MGQLQVKCPHCGADVAAATEQAGQTVACPQCGGSFRIDSPTIPGLFPASASQFPERMKANRALMGRTCSSCSQPIELGQDVFNCQTCSLTMHQSCHERAGGCMNAQCPNNVMLKPSAQPAPAAAAPGASPADLVECKFCGERIQKNARKCRHCGELQNAAARAADERRKREAAADENLTVGEIVFGVICGTIACILGLVWGIQGKKKGWKLVAIAVCTQIALAILQILLEASRH